MTDAAAAAVTVALREAGELPAGERVDAVTQLAGGWSRHTHLATAGERHYVVRVQPPGGLLDTDLAQEWILYRGLRDTEIPVPRAFAFVQDPEAFGGPFIVMEHVAGEAPNAYARADQEALAADWEDSRGLATELVEHLAAIHSLDVEGLPQMSFDDVVGRWRTVYEERRLVRDPVVEEAFHWVSEREPEPAWPGLVHGDYRPGNCLIDSGRVAAILDWELAYRGDVRFDLGYLAIPRNAGKHLRAHSPLMGAFADRGWFMDRYAQLTGRVVSDADLATFAMLAIMMLLATQFTAVWMYEAGRTTDVRMAWSRFSFAGLRQDMIELMGW